MRAIVHYTYGSPDVLQWDEAQKPSAGDDEVLVKVRAASVNPADWHTLRADPFLIRLMGDGLLKPKNKGLGIDLAGQVEAVGAMDFDYRQENWLHDGADEQEGFASSEGASRSGQSSICYR